MLWTQTAHRPNVSHHIAFAVPVCGTKSYKILLGLILVLFLVCLAQLAVALKRSAELDHEVRYASDIIWWFETRRDDAFKSNVTNAADILWELHYPGMDRHGKPEPFHGTVAHLVESQRFRRERDIVNFLQAKTGDNLGFDPETWIFKYASDQSKEALKAMKEPDAAPAGSTN